MVNTKWSKPCSWDSRSRPGRCIWDCQSHPWRCGSPPFDKAVAATASGERLSSDGERSSVASLAFLEVQLGPSEPSLEVQLGTSVFSLEVQLGPSEPSLEVQLSSLCHSCGGDGKRRAAFLQRRAQQRCLASIPGGAAGTV